MAPPTGMAANHARQQSTCDKLDRIEATLRTMRRERTTITYPAVARRANVSRTFLYQNPDARNLVTTAIAASGDQRRRTQAATDAQIEASWHQRALNAEDALKAAYSEIDTQRERIGILLGQLRDLQAEYTEGAAQPRTPSSNSAPVSWLRTTVVLSSGCKQPAPTTVSSANAWLTSKPNSSTLNPTRNG